MHINNDINDKKTNPIKAKTENNIFLVNELARSTADEMHMTAPIITSGNAAKSKTLELPVQPGPATRPEEMKTKVGINSPIKKSETRVILFILQIE